MSTIITGALAMCIQRAKATTTDRLDAAHCMRILSSAYPTLSAIATIQRSIESGPCERILRSRGLRLADNDEPGHLSHFDVILPHTRSIHPSDEVSAHYVSFPLAGETLLRVHPSLELGEEVYVSAPGLTWILASSHMHDVESLETAMELCGTYARSSSGGVAHQVPAATTPAELEREINAIKHAACGRRVHGLSRALKMAPFVLGGSASPMETKVAALLSLPRHEGGWGVRGLSLNHRIELSKGQREIAGRPYLVLDGFVAGARVGYEYDSREFHDREDLAYRDRVRVSAAQCVNIRLLSLTADIVMDEERCAAFCDEFARLSGKRQRPLGPHTIRRSRVLRRDLGLPLGASPRLAGGDVPIEAYEAMGLG